MPHVSIIMRKTFLFEMYDNCTWRPERLCDVNNDNTIIKVAWSDVILFVYSSEVEKNTLVRYANAANSQARDEWTFRKTVILFTTVNIHVHYFMKWSHFSVTICYELVILQCYNILWISPTSVLQYFMKWSRFSVTIFYKVVTLQCNNTMN